MKKYSQHFLSQTVHLLLYFMMGVSALSIIAPWFSYNFDFTTWGNGGGFSIACDIIFIERFYFNKKYCVPTRYLPFAMLFINITNIIANEFFPIHYEMYGKWYEITIFSITLLIASILMLNNKINKRHNK